ncbi:hypothetical protein [Ornithinimicrobium pratense]|uniref:Uncharacterized protein n=1 Tax=Ornithinimicrobium pratense TaxID=2593973 RepID=A0A5J6V5R7_9MICO|nr:hypothetical protein [Ornithinimicrobium pratense]QFG69115.1 hypothetical protein FY030_10720 [Ornithinimicrobium pratense]
MQIADIMALVVPPTVELLRRARAAEGERPQEPEPMFPTLIAVRHQRVVASVSTPRMSITLNCALPMAVGLDPQALVVAAQAHVEGHLALAYSVMTRDRTAKFVLQTVAERDGQLVVGRPADGGEPADPHILQTLAEAMGQRPVDVTRVARKDMGGTFGEDTFLPPEQGQVVVDAGTVKNLQQRVKGVRGRALYVARSPEAGRLALKAGLPRTSLLTSESPEVMATEGDD